MPYGKLVYAWFNGETHADMVVDHINQNPLDCRPENLREVSNEWNTHKNKRNWKWPQTKQFKTESHEFLVKAMNIWIKKHKKPESDEEFGVEK